MTQLNLSLNLEDNHFLGSYRHSSDVQKIVYTNGSKKSQEFYKFQMREEKYEKVQNKANLFCFFDAIRLKNLDILIS
jgi:hypothetical protein